MTKNKIKDSIYKNILGKSLAIPPRSNITFKNKELDSGGVFNDMYWKWNEQHFKKRVEYKNKNGKYPEDDIFFVTVEVYYDGDVVKDKTRYLTRVMYSREYEEVNGKLETIWDSIKEEMK